MRKYSFIFFLVSIVLVFLCCGKKGPILPPLKKIPKKVNITEAFQRGEKIWLKWKNPSTYLDGTPLAEISKVEIWIYKKQIEEGEDKSVDLKTFKKESALLKFILGSDLPEYREAETEDSLVYVYNIGIDIKEFQDHVFFFRMKAEDKKGKESEFSKMVSIEPKVAPLPPHRLNAGALKDRVKLEWETPEKNTDGSSPACVTGYHLYRASEESPFDRINEELIEETEYEDEQIIFGEEYKYFVRSSASEESPFLESENSEMVKVTVKDVIPPEKPQGLVLVAAEDRITITWDDVKDNDLSGYYVYRRVKGDEKFFLITLKPVKENIFHDFSAEKGIEYEYRVSACDPAGNESEKSDIITGILKGYRS